MKDLNLPLVANYLSQLPFPYARTEESIGGSLAQLESNSLCSASPGECSPTSPAPQADGAGTPTSCSSPEDFPAAAAMEPLPVPAAAVTAPPSPAGWPSSPHGPSPCLPHGPSLHSLAATGQAALLHPNSSPSAPATAFQPLFFTGTLPCNMQGNAMGSPTLPVPSVPWFATGQEVDVGQCQRY